MSAEEKIKENKKRRSEATALKAKNDALAAEVKKAKKTSSPTSVKGSYTAKWDSPMDGPQSREVAFVDGHKNLFLNGERVPTDLVIKSANGKATPKDLENHGWLTQKTAEEFLTKLAQINYGYLKPVG